MGQIFSQVQYQFKKTSTNIFHFILRFFSGFFIGLVFSFVGQEIMEYGHFLFLIVIAIVIGVFLRISKKWSFLTIILFDLLFILLGALLKMYIVMAPGS